MVSSENKQKNKEKVKIGWGDGEKVEKEGLKLHMWSKKLWNTEEEKK